MTEKYITLIVSANTLNILNSAKFLAINSYGCAGIEEFALEESQVDDLLGERAYSGGDIPDALYDEVQNAQDQKELVYKFFFYGDNKEKYKSFMADKICDDLTIEVKEDDWADWNNEWRKSYKRLEISESLSVVPEWERTEDKKDEIYIYPGMGFGTGNHETTYLCLLAFMNLIDKIQGPSCLDFGCGSGILGVAAIKKKNMVVDFCDIDKDALENCLQNITLNFKNRNLDGTTLVLRDRFVIEKTYDVVFANILENVLLLEKDLIMNTLHGGSFLIVSGLLVGQKDSLAQNYTDGSDLELVADMTKNDWACLVFKKK